MIEALFPLVGVLIAALAGWVGYIIGFDRGFVRFQQICRESQWESLEVLEKHGFIRILPEGERKLKVIK